MPKQETPRLIKKVVIFLWSMLFVGVIAVALLFYAISEGKIGYMPPVEELENPNYSFASQVISSDGQVFGTYSLSKENRIYVGYDELPKPLIDALVATEDVRFYEHSGIDLRAVARAVVKRGLLHQKNAGGGSTITQQLSKQLYSPSAGSVAERFLQKPIEWVIATKLERFYTKEEILTLYLNKYDWGYTAVGIRNAAMTYFGKEPIDLSIDESATLIGMCQNSSLYNPVRRTELTQQRRNVVLSQMEKAGYLTQEACDSLQEIPLSLNFHPVTHNDGIGTYFREYLRLELTASEPQRSNYASWQNQQYYEDSLAWATNPLYGWCQKNRKKDGSPYNLYVDGLKIYTTIDSRMQRYAEDAMEEHVGEFLQSAFFQEQKGKSNAPYTNLSVDQVHKALDRAMKQSERYNTMKAAGADETQIRDAFNQKEPMSVFTWKGVKDTLMSPMDSIRYYKYFLRTGIVSMDPFTGAVKAYVGGLNYRFFQYDMALRGRRQVGSTIKPFLYSLAMEHGMTPCDQTVNQPIQIGNWSPRNASSSRVGELVTLHWGLSQSNNWISAYVMSRLSPYEFVSLIHSFGVLNRDIYPSPVLCLGPCDISVGEMASAYTAFVNKGLRCAPMLVTRIEDADGNIIANFTPQMNEVISANSAQNMLSMLVAVVNEGTGRRVRRYTSAAVGGKTGTTQNNSDGWFVGLTPSLVTACWVGGDDRDIHFRSMRMGQGASMALPIWGLYMKKIYADKHLPYRETEKFPTGTAAPCESDSLSQEYPLMQEYPATSGGEDDIIIEN
ncbi:MAG: transglycosylase domain-containing protein [Bacteroidaceae bacterium]